jgi:pimeloyl-ACP methyl ester carboxylesterase
MPETTLTPATRPIDCPRHSPCVDLSYIDAGQGPALVLIHGLGGRAAAWEQQIEALSSSYRVIAPDLRGHGNSGYRAEEPVTIRALADDLVALLGDLGVEQAHVCGNSMGGMIALELWVRYPAWLKSLILAGTAAFYPPPHVLDDFLRLFDQMDMTAWAGFMAPRLLRRRPLASLLEEVVQTMAATSRDAYRQGLAAVFLADYRWALPLIDIPALILVGEEDQAAPVGYARFLAHHLKGSRLRVVPEAAHLLQQENPGEVNRQLREHLERFGDK